MTRWLLVGIGLGLSSAVAAPLTHQGRALDGGGGPINGTHTVVVSLIEADDDVAFTESHQVTFEDGYYALRIGTIEPINPGIFDEPLDIALTINGQPLGREPLSAVPQALSVDGYVRLSATLVDCTSSSEGALSYDNGRLMLCNGTQWVALAGKTPVRSMTILANNTMEDEDGNFTFSTTSAIRYDTTASEGTHSLSALVYGSAGTSTPDWAAQTQPDPQWALREDLEDWQFEWDYRHTSDNGYGRILFASTTEWADDHANWCPPGTPAKTLSSGWMVCMYWGATKFYFHGTGGYVSWPYSGYHSDWKNLRLVRRGDLLEFFINGVSQGLRSLPAIESDPSEVLYISGSTNGSQTSYNPSNRYSTFSQMDHIRFGPR